VRAGPCVGLLLTHSFVVADGELFSDSPFESQVDSRQSLDAITNKRFFFLLYFYILFYPLLFPSRLYSFVHLHFWVVLFLILCILQPKNGGQKITKDEMEKGIKKDSLDR